MKILSASALFLLLLLPSAQSGKMQLLCQSWKEVGVKSFDRNYRTLDAELGEAMTLKSNGTYQTALYGGFNITGNWKLNADSNKLVFQVTKMNGNSIPDMPLNKKKPVDSIMRLSADTLIIASLKYYGPNKIYGHDDKYYVRVR
jgi:hypothetical protein